jgi:hypothetical protein
MVYHRFKVLREHGDVSSGLWIILLEAGSALALLLALVWWTLPRKPRNAQGTRNAGEDSPPPR